MKTFIGILSYLGTLGAGVAIGVLSTRTYFAKRETERADKEIYSMKEAIKRADAKKKPKSEVVNTKEATDIPSFRHYSTFSSATDVAEKEHPKEEESEEPYFIDIDDFDAVTLGYVKKELEYYMDDGTLVDEEENILSIVDTVGVKNIEFFEDSLESCCYIRNEKLREDYEISKVFSRFTNA